MNKITIKRSSAFSPSTGQDAMDAQEVLCECFLTLHRADPSWLGEHQAEWTKAVALIEAGLELANDIAATIEDERIARLGGE